MACCTGTPGATGPAGPAGVSVLYNDMTTSTITTTGSEVAFTAPKTFTIPASTFTSVGDKIKVTGVFWIVSNLIPKGVINCYFNNQLCNAMTVGKYENSGVGGWILLTAEISLTSTANTFFFNDLNWYCAKNTMPIYSEVSTEGYFAKTLVAPYSSGITIEFKANLDNPVGTLPGTPLYPDGVTCYQLLIEHYKI